MSQAQKGIAAVGFLVIALLGIYPPWVRVEPDKPPQPMGYGFLWDPPVVRKENHTNIFGITVIIDMEPVEANAVDFARLLTSWGAAAALTLLALYLARASEKPAATAGKKEEQKTPQGVAQY